MMERWGIGARAPIALVLLLLGSMFDTAKPAEPTWQVGLADVCITPDEPVWLYGYAGKERFQPFDFGCACHAVTLGQTSNKLSGD